MDETKPKKPLTPVVISGYLVVTEAGSVTARKTRPSLDVREVAVGFNLTLPRELFRRPSVEVNIEVPPEAITPTEIGADVVGNIRDAIIQAGGHPVSIEVRPPKGE